MTDFTPALQKVSHTLVHFGKKNGTGTEAPMPVHFPVSFCAVNPLTPGLWNLRFFTEKGPPVSVWLHRREVTPAPGGVKKSESTHYQTRQFAQITVFQLSFTRFESLQKSPVYYTWRSNSVDVFSSPCSAFWRKKFHSKTLRHTIIFLSPISNLWYYL